MSSDADNLFRWDIKPLEKGRYNVEVRSARKLAPTDVDWMTLDKPLEVSFMEA